MKSGMVYLYYRDGEFISAREYGCKSERDAVIEGWERRYAAAMKNTFIQIAPTTGEGVKTDGTNKLVSVNKKRNYKNEYVYP
jgi:hypothetical protein